MNFTRQVDSETYQRWHSSCGLYIITWSYYSGHGSRGVKSPVKPGYIAYYDSRTISGRDKLPEYADAVTVCEEHEAAINATHTQLENNT